MTDLYGRYQSQSTRGLARIDSSKYPDTNKDFESNVRRLNGFVDYISQYLQQMQKGVDQASADPITKIRDVITDFGIMLGGGELLYGIDLGDLQYYLPALGAMFGFDTGEPFPLNLFTAAEHFLLGFIVPLDSFVFVIEDIINGWLVALGIDPDFITAVDELLDEIQGLTTDFGTLLSNILGLFNIIGVGGDDGTFGPFADLWHIISQIFGGFSIQGLFDLTDPIFDALAPWVHELAEFIGWLDDIIKSFSGGLTNIDGILNFSSLFAPLDFLSGAFNVGDAWGQIVNLFMIPLNLLLGPNSPLSALNIFGLLNVFNLPSLPISHLTNTTTANLLVEPGFDDPDAFVPGQGWVYDITIGHTSLGSAKVTAASGLKREMQSIPIPASHDQTISASVWIRWQALAYSGTTTPFKCNILAYQNGTLIDTHAVASPVSPATNGLTFTQYSITGYAPPTGTDTVKMQFYVDPLATGGNVWFDDVNLTKTTSGLPQNWIFDLIPDLDDVRNFIQSIVDGFIGILTGLPIVGGFISGLLAEFSDFFDGTQDTAAQAGDALLISTTLEPQVATVQSQVVNQQNYTITNQVSGRRNPRYICKYPRAEVTFPEFYMTELSTFGTTAGVTGGAVTAHTHDFDINSNTVETGAWGILQGQAFGSYLGISDGLLGDTIGILARKRTNTSIDNVFLEVFKESPDGSTYQISSDDISSQLGYPDMGRVEVAVPNLIVCQPGETYMIKVRNSSTVNTTVSVQGIWQSAFVVDSAWGCSGSDALKTSYTAAENIAMKATNQVLMWSMIAQQIEYPIDLSFPDSFNRGSLGEIWKLQQSTAADHLDIVARGYIGFYGGGGGSVAGIRTQSISSDRMRVDGYLTGTGVAPPSGLIACSDEMMTNFVLLYVNSAGAKLYSTTNGSTYTQRSTVSKGANDGMWSVYYEPGSNRFRVMQDGVLITGLDWTDTGNVITHGPTKRFAGARTDAVIFLFQQTKGPLISDFNVSDWSP